MSLKETALHALHIEAGGRMVDFAGWHMPVQYQGALKEHQAVRSAAGLFDVSHMGEIEIVGPDAASAVQRLTCNDLSRIEDGQAQYSALLTEQGTFVDDIVIYRFSSQRIFICVNAANKDKDFDWISSNLEGQARALDKSSSYSQLAIQGPKAQSALQQLTDADLSAIRYYSFEMAAVCGAEALISRTGYTGEDGFEVYSAPDAAPGIWKALLESGRSDGIQAAGLAARNTLRLEVCFALYGNDIDDQVTPLEAGLGWIAKLDQDDFIGREALMRQKEQGVPRKLAAFEMIDRGIARDGFPVYINGEPYGGVRSGSFGPTVEKSVGLTYLPADKAKPGQEFEIEVRSKRLKATVVKKPFYKRDQTP